MMGASIAQTQLLQKALKDATLAGGEVMLTAVTKSVEALQQGFAEATLDPTPKPPAETIAATLDAVLALLADIKTEHAKG